MLGMGVMQLMIPLIKNRYNVYDAAGALLSSGYARPELYRLITPIGIAVSVALTVLALLFLALAGLPELPTDATPYSGGVKLAVIVMFCVIPMLAWAATLWAMRGYSLTGAKMKEIQAVNAARRQAIAEGTRLEEAMKIGSF